MTFILSILSRAAIAFFTNLIIRSSSEKMLATLFFAIAEKFSTMTTNKVDDKVIADLKESYYGSNITLKDLKNDSMVKR